MELQILRLEVDECFPESDGPGEDEWPADIEEVVVSEEICVSEDGDGRGDPEWGKSSETKVEATPCARYVGTDRRIHEAGEQRHGTDAKEGMFWITPRADRIGGFKKFHGGGHDVEK